ncbi:MAG: F0F1 ATP synthase subunit A [Armatimonadetes bacterium]|nr:F0F1 ATP synthase subunit A [Armatimonadota bacterium]
MGDLLHLGTTLLAEGGAEHGAAHHGANFVGLMVYLVAIIGVVVYLLADAKKGLNNRYFTRWTTQRLEQLYLFVENMAVGIIGAHGRKYIPMVMTLWLLIFFGNLTALFFATSPTADLSFNLGLALIAVFYVQWEGMRANGVGGHFKHFAGPKLSGALMILTPMIFIIELVSEMMKNLSLSLRLYGNIDGGHKAAEAMNELGKSAYVPFGAFLMPLKLMTCVVQALIFTLLFCVYLSLVTHADHGDAHGEAHAH